ncbi:hypothetical protein ALC60_12463 [Trachymyrmex zeteki]|uniref:Uncharacterized protein n=1 Tax=Mycetomoellerius zeteki TaxID=64791 RepID=A0A151WKV1_9HYME|nr:hypothetical protein ALC60_12463 [Trachymyrmex zeteki]
MLESARSSFDSCVFLLNIDLVLGRDGARPIDPEELDLPSFFVLDCSSVTRFSISFCSSTFSSIELDISSISVGFSFVRDASETLPLFQRSSSGCDFFFRPRFFALCGRSFTSGILKCSKLTDNRSLVSAMLNSSVSFKTTLADLSSGSFRCSSANDFFFAPCFSVVFEGIELTRLEFFKSVFCVSLGFSGTISTECKKFSKGTSESLVVPIFIDCILVDSKDSLAMDDEDGISSVSSIESTEVWRMFIVAYIEGVIDKTDFDFLFDLRLDEDPDFSRLAINFAFSQVISEKSVNFSRFNSLSAFVRFFSKFVGFKSSLIISLSFSDFLTSISPFEVSTLSSFFENSFPISALNVSFIPSFFCAFSSVRSSTISSDLFLFFLDLASSDLLLDFLLDFVTPFFLSGFSKFSFCVIINEPEIEISVNDTGSFEIFIGITGSLFIIDLFSQDSTFSSTELTFLCKSSSFFISTSETLSALI